MADKGYEICATCGVCLADDVVLRYMRRREDGSYVCRHACKASVPEEPTEAQRLRKIAPGLQLVMIETAEALRAVTEHLHDEHGALLRPSRDDVTDLEAVANRLLTYGHSGAVLMVPEEDRS
jgi:hypothetical protein